MRAGTILIIPLLFLSLLSVAQPQLVLLNREKVYARFTRGDDFIYMPKNSNKYVTGFITDIQEFYIVTFNDTVRFTSIERVSLKGQPKKGNIWSTFLITAGVAYFVLDQFNNVVVQGNPADLDPSVWKPSLIMVASGVIIRLIHKRSLRVRFPARLMMVESGSKFFKDDR